MISSFRVKHDGCFEVTSRAVAGLDEEERLMPVLSNLSRQYLGPEYGAHRASSERVTADQVDGVSSAAVTDTIICFTAAINHGLA